MLLPELMHEYRRQIEKGMIQQAYQGLIRYMGALRSQLKAKHPEFHLSSLYQGYMDMTYFSFTPTALKDKNLKIAIVFLHESFRFEVWLAAANKQVQEKYWQYFKDRGWHPYHLVPAIQGADAILEHTLVEDPDFADLDQMSDKIETKALSFIRDVEAFLK